MSRSRPGRSGPVLAAALWLAVLGPLPAQPDTAREGVGQDAKTQDGFRLLDGVAARVNGEVITWNEVRSHMVATALGYDRDPEGRERALVELARNRLRGLIQDRLLLQLARQEGIETSREEVEWYLKKREEEHGSAWELSRFLSEKGMSLVDFRRDIRDEIQRYKFIEARRRHTPWASRLRRYTTRVGPGEVRAYYVEHREGFRVRACVWLRRVHILADEHGGQDRARALAEEVVRDLRSGLKPAEVDVRHSLGCEQLTCSVDELEPRERDSGLRRDIKEWAFSSTVGAVSDPMELEPGNLAVFLVARKTEEAVRPFEEVQGEIEEQLGNQRRREVEKALLADLYRDANLEPPALRAWLLRTGPAPDVDREVIASILSKPL